jgi:heterotetrameric sarcosine oxidase gamma subunit
MIQKGNATVTDAPRFHLEPRQFLVRLELWGEVAVVSARFEGTFGTALPAASRSVSAGDLRIIWREPKAWMIAAPLARLQDVSAKLTDIVGDDGAVTDISGAAVRCTLRGPDWRALLTHGGVFDAEDPAFAPGCVAGTVVEHINLRIDVVSDNQADVYVAPSYAVDLLGYWETVAGSLVITS